MSKKISIKQQKKCSFDLKRKTFSVHYIETQIYPEKRHEKEHEKGHEKGYENGHEKGHENGHEKGHEKGYENEH